jgi:hypothetical protein
VRLRVARKIYFPRDVGNVYNSRTLARAYHRLRMGNNAKWHRWSDWREERRRRMYVGLQAWRP